MEIKVPKSVKILTSSYVYGSKNSSDTIVIPEGIEEIDKEVFSGSSIKKIVLPQSLKKIGDYAFSKCRDLKEILLPDELEEIGNYAFYECNNLEYVRLPRTLKKIGKQAFNTKYVYTWYERTPTGKIKTRNGFSVTHSIEYESKIKRILLPPSLKEIGEDAFGYQNYLSYNKNKISYFVPKNSVAEKFALKQGYTVIQADIINGALMGPPMIGSTFCYAEKDHESVTIPETVKKIDEYAFYGCVNMNDVTFSSSLTEIGVNAFRGCINLRKVVFKTNGHLETIGEYAFGECENIEKIIIPKSVTEICDNAFRGCKKLDKIVFQNDSCLKKIGSKAFCNYPLTLIDLPSSVETLSPDAFPQNCIVSVGGDMPGYSEKRKQIVQAKNEIEKLKQQKAGLQHQIKEAQKTLNDHISSYPAKFKNTTTIESDIREAENDRDDQLTIAADEQKYLERRLAEIDLQYISLAEEKKKCSIFAFIRKKELNEDIDRKLKEMAAVKAEMSELRVFIGNIESQASLIVNSLKKQFNDLEAEKAAWNKIKTDLKQKKQSLEKACDDLTQSIATKEALLKKTTNDLDREYKAWQTSVEKEKRRIEEEKRAEEELREKQRKEAKERERTNKLKSEKAELLSKLNVPQYDKIPTYWFTSRNNVIEEDLLNDSFIRMIVALNENNEASSRNEYIEKNKTKIERIKVINGLLGCSENEGLRNLMPIKAPEVAKSYLPERFKRLASRFSELEAWGNLKKSAGELLDGVYDSKSILKRFFGKNDHLKLDAEKQQLLFFPHCMVEYSNGAPLFVLTYDKTVLDIECVEEEMVTDIIPEYGELIGERHKHLNQDGSVSRRYKDNPVIKTIRYTKITVKSALNSYAFPMKTYQDAVQLKQVYDDYRSFITTDLVGKIYDLFLQCNDVEIIEKALDNLEFEIQARIEQEKERAEEEMRRREEERAAAKAVEDERRKAIIQRQRELNEERKREAERQAETHKKVVQMFDDDFEPAHEELESGTSENISLPVEIAGNRTITNNVFKVSVKALKDLEGDWATYFVSSSGEIISNKKKVPALHDAEQAQIGFILNSGIDYTTMHKCCMRLESAGTRMGDIEFDMNISFYSDF